VVFRFSSDVVSAVKVALTTPRGEAATTASVKVPRALLNISIFWMLKRLKFPFEILQSAGGRQRHQYSKRGNDEGLEEHNKVLC
jgi:hypothetical protein